VLGEDDGRPFAAMIDELRALDAQMADFAEKPAAVA